MTNLAVWRIDESGTSPGGQAPLLSAVERSHLGLEKHLEAWIAADAKLIGGGLTIVGRQVRIDDGILDLLAIDARDRWVVIELKAGRLDGGALHQALSYASSLARLSADDLCAKLEPDLQKFGDAEMLSARLRQLLDSEVDGGPREIAVALVGVGRLWEEHYRGALQSALLPGAPDAIQPSADVLGDFRLIRNDLAHPLTASGGVARCKTLRWFKEANACGCAGGMCWIS